jgi:GntR family transcriptional regulator, transcriptional repressor for pyruvate dehydrogenase complex
LSKQSTPLILEVEERVSLSVLVSRQLRSAIVSGQISSGDEFPTEKELSEQLGVGRSTVREALVILQAQGLLSGKDVVSTRRPTVAPGRALTAAAATAIENALLLGNVPLHSLLELRVVIEGAIVRGAASAADESRQALAQSHLAVAEMRAAGADIERFRAADFTFHRSLAEASGNSAFGLVMGVLRSAISGYLGEALEREPNPALTMAALTTEHSAILDAVERRQATRAAGLMQHHVEDFYRGRSKSATPAIGDR